ncbi:MAG: SpaA isopeptide-forming pilin-related protein [Candidatus Micrarchaeota archaeon]
MADFIESLREKWDAFLDWSEDKGLPLKGIALAMEERGIPSLPAFLVLIIALAFLAVTFLGPMLAPPTSKVALYAKSVDGTAVLSGVAVTLHSDDGKTAKEGTTNSEGLVLFDSLPAGKYYADYSSETYVFDNARVEFETKAGKQAEMTNAGSVLMSSRLQLYFTVDGPDNADVYLFSSDGTTQLDHKYGFADGFDVESNKDYVVRASADGYSPVERAVRVGATNTDAVTLKLPKVGGEGKGTVRVGVFTSDGLEGVPIANASVEIRDAATGAALFTLTSSESGDCESQQVLLGTEIAVSASADGYVAAIVAANVSDETNVKVRLDKALASNAGELGVRVRDANGNAIVGATVSIYSQDVVFNGAELAKYAGVTGLDGSVLINVSRNERLSASGFKPGYLPAFVDNVAPGADVSLTLGTATPYNSGTVGIVATDKAGVPVAGAVIALLDNRSAPLGIPAKITAPDGTQNFESVPAGAVRAVAAWGGRIAFTDAVDLNAGETIEIPVSFPPVNGSALFSAIDYFSGKPLDGVTIAIGNATCETRAGSCAIETLESEAITATAVAAGYERLETAQFAILPNAEARVQLAMLNTRVVGEANLLFVGVFDLAGNRMKTLKPSTTYEARYVIRAPTGLEFTQAEAHVRLGELQGTEDAAEITAWKAFGGYASSGSSYEEAAAFTPAAAGTETGKNTVTLNEFEAFPADSEFAAGADGRATVYFRNAGNETRRIAIEGLLDSGVTIEPGKEFSYTFVKTGGYQFKDLDKPEISGTVSIIAAQAAASEASVAAAAAETGIKWVNFVFDPFTASREIAVQFRTKQVTTGKVSLYHRSAFKTQATVLRQPADADAGVTKSPLLANAAASGAFEIAFGGECGEGVCVEWEFNGDANFEAPLGKEFKLNFRVFGEPNEALTVRLRTSAVALKLKNAVAGGAGYSPASEKEGTQENAINVKCGSDGTASGSFVMESRRLAADAELDLDVLAAKTTEPVFSKQLFLRVVAESAPSLKVEFAPKAVVALAQTKMTFTVKDQYGAPVSGAHVVIGNDRPELIAGNALEAQETDKAGEYAVESVEPQGIGTIDYVVEAGGFMTAKGEFAVLPPAKILEVTPAKLQGSVDSGTAAAISFTVANKVSNGVQVRAAALVRGTPAQFTDMFPAPASFSLKAGETRDAELIAGLDQQVLLVSDKPQTLGESVEGVLRITARIGRVTQNIDVPLSIKTSFRQEALDDAWETSATELSFDLDAETEKTQTQALTITNNGPYPLLINQENTMEGGFVQPLSAIIAPGTSEDFAVTSSVAQDLSRSCFIEEGTKEGVLSLYASFQGIASRKTVSLSSAVTNTGTCAPEGGFSLGLPADVRLALPAGTKQNQNSDGSATVKLPDGSLMLFAAGASLTAAEAQVPMNIPIVVPPQWVSSLGNGAWRLVLPVQAQIAIPADTTPQSQPDSTVLLILGGAQLVLPAGTQISLNPSGERVALLPAGTPLIFQTLPFTSLLEMLSPYSVEVSLPVETTFIMPPGTIEVKQPDSVSPVAVPQGANAFYGANQQLSSFGYNPKVVKLPDGSTLGFTQEATSKTDASGLLQVTVPADAPFLVPGGYVAFAQTQTTVLEGKALEFADKEGAFVLLLPMPALFTYSGDEAALTRDSANNKYLLKVGTDAAMEFSVQPAQTTQTGTSRKALMIPAMSPITVLYGGAARGIENPTDVSACPETFKAEQATIMDFPTGTHASRSGSVLVLTPAECTDAAKITVTTKEGQELYTSPAAFKVEVAGGQISKGAEGDDSAKTVNVPAKSLITFKICAKGDASLKTATLTVPGQADITLPAMSTWKGNSEVSLGGVKKISITVGSRQLDISKTDKLSFESSNPDEKILKDPKRADRVTLPPWSKIFYVPYCDKASTGKLSVKIERNVLEATELGEKGDLLPYDWSEISEKGAQPIDIEIYDDKATVKVNGKDETYSLTSDMRHRDVAALAQICIQNRGVTTIKFEQPTIEAVKGSGDLLREALPNDVDHMHFLAQEEAGKQLINIAPKPGIPCHTFEIETVIPEAAKDADLCIKEDYVVEGYLVLKGEGEKAAPLERRIPIRYTLKAGNCASKNKDKAIKDFDQVAAAYSKDELSIDNENYKQMSFKQAGHARYLSLLNNRDEDVTLTVSGQGRTMDCRLQPAPKVDALEQLKDGVLMPAGEAAVYKCTGIASGDYVITFTGARSGKTLDKDGKPLVFTKHIIVKVWDPVPAAYAGIYAATPLGSVFVSDKYMASETTTPETPAAAKETAVAPATKSTHADEGAVSLADKEEAPKELAQIDGYDWPMYNICRNYFCTYSETETAFRTFLQLALMSLNDKTKTEASINHLCSQLPSGKQSFQRSSVMQMTNTLSETGGTKRDLLKIAGDAVSKASGIAGDAGYAGVVLDPQTNNQELRGCGVYVATATADLKCAGRSEKINTWRSKVTLQVSIRKIAECPVNVANAALLTAEEPEQFVGKKPIGAMNLKGQYPGGIQLGAYSPDSDPKDVQTADALREALYGSGMKKEWNYVKDGTVAGYEDAGFCTAEATKVGGEVVGASVTMLGTAMLLQVGQGAATGGAATIFQAPGVVKAVFGLSSALAMCIVGQGKSVAKGGGLGSCDAWNDCAYGAVAGSIDAIFSSVPGGVGSGGALVGIFGARFVTDLALIGGSTAALETTGAADWLSNALSKDIPSTAPYDYAGGKLLRNSMVYLPKGGRVFQVSYLMAKRGYSAAEAAAVTRLADSLKRGKPNILIEMSARSSNMPTLKEAKGGTFDDYVRNTLDQPLDPVTNLPVKIDAAKMSDNQLDALIGKKLLPSERAELSRMLREEFLPARGALGANYQTMLDKLADRASKVTTPSQLLDFERSLTFEEWKVYDEVGIGAASPAEAAKKIRSYASFTDDMFTTGVGTLTPIQKQLLLNALSDERMANRGFAISQLKAILGKDLGPEELKLAFKKLGYKSLAKDIAAIDQMTADELNKMNGKAVKSTQGVTEGVEKVKASGKGFLTRAGGSVANLAAVLLFYIDVKPVRAEYDYGLMNHYVVSRTKDDTLYAYCQKDASTEKCAEGADTRMQDVCSADAAGCVKISKANLIGGVQGYSLFVAVNDDALRPKQKQLLSSIFEPNEPPFNAEGAAARAFGSFKVEVMD